MNKKLATGAAAGVIVLAGSGIALAYWTASGSGTGSASTAAGASDLTIVQTSTISDLAPGGAAQDIAGSVTNNAANSAYVSSVTVSIASVSKAAGAVGDCDASDYTLANPVMNVGQNLAPDGAATFSGATIVFANDAAANQDGCKGATVNLAYAAA